MDVGLPQVPLRLWTEESGSGEPVLLIHGLGASIYTWRSFLPNLARTHRTIAIDLKGAGKSDKPNDEAYGILDQAALLKTFVEREALSHLTIIGHSMGGGVALALALELNRTNPWALKRLVLISSVAYRQQLPYLGFMKKPFLGSDGRFALPPEVLVYVGLYNSYYAPSKITFDAVRTYAHPPARTGWTTSAHKNGGADRTTQSATARCALQDSSDCALSDDPTAGTRDMGR